MAKTKCPVEHDEQVRVIEWWANACKLYGVDERCLYAVPNGGYRAFSEARRLKDEGQRNGIPDLCLCVPKGIYHGMYIELKRVKGGVVRPEQTTMIEELNRLGYAAGVARGAEMAICLIKAYMEQ